jgi:short-subunit dehydrogenase
MATELRWQEQRVVLTGASSGIARSGGVAA